MKRFLLTFTLGLSLSAFSQVPKALYTGPHKEQKLCVVISGKAHDYNNFLDEKLFSEGEKVAGVDCHVFGNWNDAVVYAKANLEKEGQLLVVQGAHGNDNGSYNVSEGSPATAEEVFKNLKDLSQTFQVGSVIHSCYSASIMNQKLIDDEGDNDRLDKLCLVSSSSFGRLTTTNPNDIIQNLLKLRPGESLETPFKNNLGGVISSAPWSEVGLPEYLMSKKTALGFATLEKMDAMMRGGAKCSNLGQANAALCLSPGITDETYEDIMTFMNPKVEENRKGFFEHNLASQVKKLKEKVAANPNDAISKHGMICKQKILSYFQTKFGEKLYKLQYYPEVMTVKDQIEAQPFFKTDCLPYKATLKEEWQLSGFITESFATGVDEYIKTMSRLRRKYSQKKFDETFDLYKFANDAIGEKKSCGVDEKSKLIQSKEMIVQSLFGQSFFLAENVSLYNGNDLGPDEKMIDQAVSTQLIMKGFQDVALSKNDYKNVKDQQRRKACQDFKF